MKKVFFLPLAMVVFVSCAMLQPQTTTDDTSTNQNTTQDQNIPSNASVNGKYYNLLQTVNCPADASQYGDFRDYGSWSGSNWCGQTVQSGYWVWVNPNWYIWKNKR